MSDRSNLLFCCVSFSIFYKWGKAVVKNGQKHMKKKNFYSKLLVFESYLLESWANHSCCSYFWATRAILSWLLFLKERQEQIAHSRSIIWAIWAKERIPNPATILPVVNTKVPSCKQTICYRLRKCPNRLITQWFSFISVGRMSWPTVISEANWLADSSPGFASDDGCREGNPEGQIKDFCHRELRNKRRL